MRNRAFGSGIISLGMIAACSLAIGMVAGCSEGATGSNAAQAGSGNVAAASSASDVGARVRRVIAATLNQESGRVSLEARLVEDLGADDLDRVEIVMALEEEFGISIPDAAGERMRTVGDAVRVVRTQTGN